MDNKKQGTNLLPRELLENIDVIFDEMHNDLLITDDEGRVLAVNTTFEALYGLKREETLGRTVYQLEDEGYFKPSIVVRVLREKHKMSLPQKNKWGRDILVTAKPVFRDDGSIRFVISFSRDITEMLELQDKLRQYEKELKRLRGGDGENSIIGVSAASKAIEDSMKTIAAYDANVIITGPSGVGKTMYARRIHKQSLRKDGPFVEVNCAAIPETLLESELFGYEKGAFTGASEKGKAGFIELADKGTLFLDEISELPLSLQAKLLKVIQDKTIIRVGGTKEKKVDFRLITATNRDIAGCVSDGTFRKDLYYRLNVLNLHVLPLKERKDDIIPLCEHFLQMFNERYGMCKSFSPGAMQSLVNYSWPGNVRELSNVVERTAMMAESDRIERVDFGEFGEESPQELFDVIDINEKLESVERELFCKAWEKYGSSVRVAKALSVSQPTAYRKLRKYVGVIQK